MDTVELELDPTLKLRLLSEDDSEELFALVEANRVYLREWLPWVDDNTELRHTREFVQSTVLEFQQGEALHLGIRMHERLIGVVGYNSMSPGAEGEIGYWLDQSLQGSGVMTRACRALLQYGFHSLDLSRQVILCDAGNVRSRRIAERLDFRLERPPLNVPIPGRALRYIRDAQKG